MKFIRNKETLNKRKRKKGFVFRRVNNNVGGSFEQFLEGLRQRDRRRDRTPQELGVILDSLDSL